MKTLTRTNSTTPKTDHLICFINVGLLINVYPFKNITNKTYISDRNTKRHSNISTWTVKWHAISRFALHKTSKTLNWLQYRFQCRCEINTDHYIDFNYMVYVLQREDFENFVLSFNGSVLVTLLSQGYMYSLDSICSNVCPKYLLQ